MQKHQVLKDNLDRAIAKSKEDYAKDNHTQMSDKRKEFEKKEFMKAVKVAEKNLPYVWNEEKDKTPDDFQRPSLGFFGGVNFDKEGNIIR